MKQLADLDRSRVGLVGLGALALVAALVMAASQLALGARTYTAQLENTGGLRPGEEVQVAGVGVGEVEDVRIAGRHVDVTFTVDDDVHLGPGTVAEVKVATLLGTHFLLVTPRGEGDLEDATVPLTQTRVPYNLQDVIDEGTSDIDALDVDALDASLREVTRTLDVAGDDVAPALTGLRGLSAVVADRSDDLGDLLSSARKVARQLRSSSGDVVVLLRRATLVLDTLRTRRATIGALLRDMRVLGTQLKGLLDDTKDDVRPMLRDLNTVVRVLTKHEKQLGKGVDTLAVAARYFANATGQGPYLTQNAPSGLPDNVGCFRNPGECR